MYRQYNKTLEQDIVDITEGDNDEGVEVLPKPKTANPKGIGKAKCTPEVTKRICDAIRRGNFKTTACAAGGVSTPTVNTWLRRAAHDRAYGVDSRYVQFADAMESAEALAEKRLVQRVESSSRVDYRAATWLLERRHPKRWGNNKTVSVQITNDREHLLSVAESVLPEKHFCRLLEALAEDERNETSEFGAAGPRKALPAFGVDS